MAVGFAHSAAVRSSAYVIPSVRKLISSDRANLPISPGYEPDLVDVLRANGGFSSVIEVSDQACLAYYGDQIGTPEVVVGLWGTSLASAIAPFKADIGDSWWQSFTPNPSLPYGIGYSLRPVDLHYDANGDVTIDFDGVVSLYGEAIKPPPPRGVGGLGLPTPGPVELAAGQAPTDAGGQSLTFAYAAPEMLIASSSGDPSARDLTAVDQIRSRLPHANLTPWVSDLVLWRPIGTITATLHARFSWRPYPSRQSVDVLLELVDATLDVRPGAGDATVFYNGLLATRKSDAEALVAPAAELLLTPTLSLVGRNAGNASVPELPDYDVRVFPVSDASGRQAICAAFDAVPGCVGTIEDVRHFIGDSDYGVIHNEYVVERAIHHQWNIGGFDRSIATIRRTTLQIQRGGNIDNEDADVYGELELNSLDTVALEPHPDLRRDFLLMSGMAEGIADRVVLLSDGTTITPGMADFGPPASVLWGVNVDPRINAAWSSDPAIRQFQQRASLDGVRHLTRPFARVPDAGGATAQYVRVEGISKRFFALGELSSFF